jgi:hypothetical protein
VALVEHDHSLKVFSTPFSYRKVSKGGGRGMGGNWRMREGRNGQGRNGQGKNEMGGRNGRLRRGVHDLVEAGLRALSAFTNQRGIGRKQHALGRNRAGSLGGHLQESNRMFIFLSTSNVIQVPSGVLIKWIRIKDLV